MARETERTTYSLWRRLALRALPAVFWGLSAVFPISPPSPQEREAENITTRIANIDWLIREKGFSIDLFFPEIVGSALDLTLGYLESPDPEAEKARIRKNIILTDNLQVRKQAQSIQRCNVSGPINPFFLGLSIPMYPEIYLNRIALLESYPGKPLQAASDLMKTTIHEILHTRAKLRQIDNFGLSLPSTRNRSTLAISYIQGVKLMANSPVLGEDCKITVRNSSFFEEAIVEDTTLRILESADIKPAPSGYSMYVNRYRTFVLDQFGLDPKEMIEAHQENGIDVYIRIGEALGYSGSNRLTQGVEYVEDLFR